MGAAHGHRLHYHGHSPVHRLPAQCKIVALVAFVGCVVATPGETYWPYAGYAFGLITVLALAAVPLAFLAPRMLVELPFVVFALLLPFIAVGPRTEVLGVAVSEPGLHAAAALLAKGTLGVAAALLLAATTEPRDLVAGLQRLRMPDRLVQIMAFMVRYVDVATAEVRRMRIARDSRCFSGHGVRAWPVLARSAGALFVRSYERGERVHLAMLSRGYTGTLAPFGTATATRSQWAAAALLPALALLVVIAAWTGVAQ